LDLEIRHLRLVAGIADAGSVTKAAAGLNLTQSALSHQLRDIEARFNTPLFLRVGKRMVLTAAGRRVLDSARRVLAELDAAEADIRRLAQGRDGVIRVATECNTGYHWLPPLLRVFNRKHPRVTVNVMPDTTDKPLQALLDGRLDVAILTSTVSDRRLRLRPLFNDEMVAVVSRTHPLARQPWVSPRDLAAQHLLLYSSSPEESFLLQRVLAPAGLVPAQVSFIMLTEAMIEMARAGLGVGILPRWSVQPAIASRAVTALAITRGGVGRRWTAATLKAQVEPPWLTDFIDLIATRAIPARVAGQQPRVIA
jgi:LysR family transcriptional regulator, regulator for metE and metH